jgi:2-methylisocitrate lyase-like PEP mutase family enzyme
VLANITEFGVTQAGRVDAMQTRAELYDVLGYLAYEERL